MRLIKAVITSLKACPHGQYLVSVTAVGHQKSFSEPFELIDANQSVQLGPDWLYRLRLKKWQA